MFSILASDTGQPYYFLKGITGEPRLRRRCRAGFGGYIYIYIYIYIFRFRGSGLRLLNDYLTDGSLVLCSEAIPGFGMYPFP